MEITEKIKESIDRGKFGCGIFIDLRKAFDTVNHDILIIAFGLCYSSMGISMYW